MALNNKKEKEKRFKASYIVWSIASAIFLLLVFLILLAGRAPQPEMIVEKVDGKVLTDSEIMLQFDWPVARQIDIEITPEVYGQIRYEDNVINEHLVKTIVFTPELTWRTGVTYQVKVSNVESALPSYKEPAEYVLVFTTEDMPDVELVSPDPADLIRVNQEWTISLDKINENLSEFDFQFTPEIEATASLSNDKRKYFIEPKGLLSQGQEYELNIFRKKIRYHFGTQEIAFQDEPESVWHGAWQVREAPGIESFSPQGNTVSLDEDISIVFSENVDLTSFKENVAIEPALEGQWITEDYKTVTFTPDGYSQDTQYTVSLKSGLSTYEGGYLEEDSVHTFKTIGPVKLLRSFPASGNQGVSVNSSVKIVFDQPVNRESAQGGFSISPQTAGSFTWDDDQTIIFHPSESLGFNAEYIAAVAKGITSQTGFDSEQAITIPFITELSVTNLAVPFHRQEHNLSCEIATLVMALIFRGINVSEATIIEAIGVDPTPKQDGVWGNPHIAFVGDIDGKQPSTGYGVYWQPIATAGQSYRESEWFTGWTITQLTNEIKNGNPVIVWGTAGSGTRIDWKTSDGGNVVAVNGEHTRIVTGFIGSADNPSKIITLDP
ncbi:Ig-like domain-containing protein, partial [Patescibacteria group bacterium]|nr:Ig-like domain-containing protein [Patescibacteria group bacterium]